MGKVTTWANDSIVAIRKRGIRGLGDAARPVYRKALHQTLPLSGGEPIYAREWDLLIVLDACRLDLFREVAHEYDYIPYVDEFRSLESMTKHWMLRNFTPAHANKMKETAYVCGNPFSEEVLNASDFALLDEVWRYAWNSNLGTLPPRPVTDRAIKVAREHEPARIIAHYMQPHCPFIASDNEYQQKSVEKWGSQGRDVWHQLEAGDTDREKVWHDYRQNLRYVLDDLKLLLENIDANKVAITSDHGNALGEWGLYGHPIHMPFRCLRNVPWVETTAEDAETHVPRAYGKGEVEVSTQERLESLGYL
ncbi:sulfatase-like hydrolase/transferase [Halegenticoccus tardaugens]|uniref:sulfatase-like hydrolase/transferase n=1 Tax=Halegenticoccus tardaugens TaxID=2071624 RepID=UPI00100B2A9B|nr:sulfatase-like hydrolase/transferase [Halegenticoccus tardaugens]